MGIYDLISIENAEKIKELITNVDLYKDIEINIPNMNLSFKANGVTMAQTTNKFDCDMLEVYFMNNNNTDVLQIKNKKYELFFCLGEWGYKARIPKSHLFFGTYPIKFSSDYFCQAELSQGLEDDKYIYIVKNISKLAGKGAISRLNNGLGDNKDEKRRRRYELVNRLNKDTILYNSDEWICLHKIDKSKLYNSNYSEKLFYEFMDDLLMYAFIVEDIISK